MKKFLTAIVILCVVLGAAYCAASWWVGSQAQKQYDFLLTEKSRLYLQRLQPYMDVTGKSYERGVFDSTAVTSVVLNPPGEGRKPLRLLVVNRIQHGPLVFGKGPHLSSTQPVMAVISSRLQGEDEAGEAIEKLLEKVPELGSSEVLTVLNLDGGGESYLDVPAFKKTIPEGEGKDVMVDWGGFNAKSRFDFGLNEVFGSFNAPALDVKGPDGQITVKNVKGDFNIHQGPRGPAVGESNFSCELIEGGSSREDVAFRLESAGIQAVSGVSGGMVNASVTARFDKLAAQSMAFGPFVFQLELRKLDADTLVRFQQKTAEMQALTAGKSDEETLEILLPLYKQLLSELLAKSPELEIKQFKAGTPWGDFNAHSQVSISGAGGSVIDNPLLALTNLSASLDATISERLLAYMMESSFRSDFQKEGVKEPNQAEKMAARKTREIVETLVSQNIIVREGQDLKTNASYRGGRMVVNGRPLNIGEMLK